MASQPEMKRTSYTWADYLSWDDGKRWEIIGGEAYEMAPAPTPKHQIVIGNLFAEMKSFFAGRKCTLLVSPVDVRLSDEDVLQPDLVVVCDSGKITATHVEGAPDLVIEVLSPSTELHDRAKKMPLYAKAGVREVWLVRPYPWLIEVFTLDGDRYVLQGAYGREDRLRSRAFRKLQIDLGKVFDYEPEPGERVQMVVREPRPPYGKAPRRTKAPPAARSRSRS